MLPKHKVFIYDEYLNRLDIGPFDTIKEAVKALGLNWSKVYYEYVNKDCLINTTVIKDPIYLVKNTAKRQDARIVINLTDNTTTSYDSISSAIRSVHIGAIAAFKRTYVHKQNIYQALDGKQYLVKFENLEDLERSKRLTLKHRRGLTGLV